MPAVSVILTAHNYGRFLDQSIRSVLDQTFQDFELIVVDDGSTDNTPAVLARYAADPRVIVVTLAGVGLARACNAGIRRSRSRYLLRLDADDFLAPHGLAIMVEVLECHPDVGLVYPDYHRVDERGRFLGHVRVPHVQDGARLLDANPLAGGALYRRACYDEIGGYDESLRYQEDYDFWLRFAERFRAYGIGLPLLSYRQHSGSMSRNRAPRAAARRHVKRGFASRYREPHDRTTLCVIPAAWPGALDRDPTLLCRELDGQAAITLAVKQARACDAIGSVVVLTDDPAVGRLSQADGAVARPSPVAAADAGSCAPVQWLRRLAATWEGTGSSLPSRLLLASPFCPLRHPDRLLEALDTLAIHGCDLVVSVDAESFVPWTEIAGGLTPITTGGRVWREAGELLAVRTSWLLGPPRVLEEAAVGYIELLPPEGWCVKDEMSWRVCERLLGEAEALRVPPAAYLRGKG